MPNKLHFIISYDVILKYICTKKYRSQRTKNINILKKILK